MRDALLLMSLRRLFIVISLTTPARQLTPACSTYPKRSRGKKSYYRTQQNWTWPSLPVPTTNQANTLISITVEIISSAHVISKYHLAANQTLSSRCRLFSNLPIGLAHTRLHLLTLLFFDVNIFFSHSTVLMLYRYFGSRFQSRILWAAPASTSCCLICILGQSSVFQTATFSTQFYGSRFPLGYWPTFLNTRFNCLFVKGHVTNDEHCFIVISFSSRVFGKHTLKIKTWYQNSTCKMTLFQLTQLGAKRNWRRAESCSRPT